MTPFRPTSESGTARSRRLLVFRSAFPVCEPAGEPHPIGVRFLRVIGDFGQAPGELGRRQPRQVWNPSFASRLAITLRRPVPAPRMTPTSAVLPRLHLPLPRHPRRRPGRNKTTSSRPWATTTGIRQAAKAYPTTSRSPATSAIHVHAGPVQVFRARQRPREPALGYSNASSSTQSRHGPGAERRAGRVEHAVADRRAPTTPHSPAADTATAPGCSTPTSSGAPTRSWPGHDHDYERIMKNGLPYFVNASAGPSSAKLPLPREPRQRRPLRPPTMAR